MQLEIQPKYKPLHVSCSCGNSFDTQSTLAQDTLHIETCAKCHPFYTGKQRIAGDSAGRMAKFLKKYNIKKQNSDISEG